MGLLFLSAEGQLPFGPTNEQWGQVQQDDSVLEDARKFVISKLGAWVSDAELLCMAFDCRLLI